MRFLMIYTPDDPVMRRHEAGEPPTPQEIAEMGKLMEDWTKAGVLLSAEGCQPSSKAARVKKSGKDIKATDGPFAEAKEVISYALYDVRSKEEAVEWASRFMKLHRDLWPEWEGESEVLKVMGPEDFA